MSDSESKHFCASKGCPGYSWPASYSPHPCKETLTPKDCVRSITITRTTKDQFQVQYCSDRGVMAHPLRSFDTLDEVANWLKDLNERII